jgi:hypothetical protein
MGCYDMWDGGMEGGRQPDSLPHPTYSMVRSASTGSFASAPFLGSLGDMNKFQQQQLLVQRQNPVLNAGLNASPFLPSALSSFSALQPALETPFSNPISIPSSASGFVGNKGHKRSLPSSPPTQHQPMTAIPGLSSLGNPFTFNPNLASATAMAAVAAVTSSSVPRVQDWASCFGFNCESVPWPEFLSRFRGFEDPNAAGPSVYADLVTAQREIEYNRLRSGLFLKHALKVGKFLTYLDEHRGESPTTSIGDADMDLEEKDEFVTRENFNNFMLLFGPLVSTKEHLVLERVLDAMTQELVFFLFFLFFLFFCFSFFLI